MIFKVFIKKDQRLKPFRAGIEPQGEALFLIRHLLLLNVLPNIDIGAPPQEEAKKIATITRYLTA